MPEAVTSARGRTVLIGGATSAAGQAVATSLVRAGADVVAVGRTSGKLAALTQAVPGIDTRVCDLTDAAAVAELTDAVHAAHGPVDGVINLVGGWRGGGGLAGQSEEDYRFLEGSFTALRHLSQAFYDDLIRSDVGRLAVVSSTSVRRPLAGGASYAALKAAAEAWTRAVAQGFAKAARDGDTSLTSAAFVYRVKALADVDQVLADSYADSFGVVASELNDRIIDLTEAPA